MVYKPKSSRGTRLTPKEVIYSYWLVFSDSGAVRLARTEPKLDRTERSMHMETTLPRSLWKTPSLRAVINVESSGKAANQVDLNIASDALKGALGIDVEMRVIEPAKESK